MIVKDESKNILRCLDSVSPYINYWVICDTGSSDNTVETIKNYFNQKNIPGEIHGHGWVNFGVNRNLALELAKDKADYILLCDADMEMVVNQPDFFSNINSYGFDEATIIQESDHLSYHNIRIVSGKKDFNYVGPTHEYITAKFKDVNRLDIDKSVLYFKDHASGFNRTNKFQRDIELLENELLKFPSNQRYRFYLAQSYRDNNDKDNAIANYKKVLYCNGYVQEKYISCLNLGRLYKDKGEKELAVFYYLKSIEFDSSRIECMVEATTILRELNQHNLVCLLYDRYKNYSKNIQHALFLEPKLYNNELEFNFSISAFYVNRKEEGLQAIKKILESPDSSDHIRFLSEKNLKFF